MTNTQSNSLRIMIPVMLSFFVMGMVDIVGVATNFARKDFQLDDLTASILPMMVFLWFAVFSIPTGILMGKIGRKKTVLAAIIIGIVALIIPYISYNFYSVILAFILLGIGNTILQVSLNPLVSSIVAKDKIAGALTFGQFVKATASFVGPILASVMAKNYGDWKLVLLVYAGVSLLSFIFLYSAPIENDKVDATNSPTSFGNTLAMLKDSIVFQLFLGILLVVGIDVCMNTNTPELLIKKLNYTTETAGLGSSLYFGARTLGAFLGAMILLRVNASSFLKINMFVALIAFATIMFANHEWMLLGAIATIGFTCANVFSIIFAIALQSKPTHTNEVSALMIMGVAGGAVVTPIVGVVAKNLGIGLSFGVLLVCVVYILFLSFKFSKQK